MVTKTDSLKNKLRKELLKSKQLSAQLNNGESSSAPAKIAANSMSSKQIQNGENVKKILQMKSVLIGKKVNRNENGMMQLKADTRPMSKLQKKMACKLSGSRFRWINENLYTAKSDDSFKLFTKEPELFSIYHEGFASQVSQWPVNPVDIFIKDLQNRDKKLVIADLGCGEAAIAKSLVQKPNIKVHSFDLVAGNEFITACDIASVPLPPFSADIAIFCLSLMGTNFVDFVKEANRILKRGGELKIAEVVSRIEDLNSFTKGIEALGFSFVGKDSSNKMFVVLDFLKRDSPDSSASHTQRAGPEKIDLLKLKPCIYKRR